MPYRNWAAGWVFKPGQSVCRAETYSVPAFSTERNSKGRRQDEQEASQAISPEWSPLEGTAEWRHLKSIRLFTTSWSHDSCPQYMWSWGCPLPHQRYLPGWEGGMGLDLPLAGPSPVTPEREVKHTVGHKRMSDTCCHFPETSWRWWRSVQVTDHTICASVAVLTQLSFRIYLLCASL